MEERRGRGRGRGIGRGREPYNRPYRNNPRGQSQGQSNQSRRNYHNFNGNGHISSQSEFFSKDVTDSQYEDASSSLQPETLPSASSQKIKMRTAHPEELGIEVKGRSPVASFLPRKPEKPGNLGRRIRVISNCFPIEIPSGYVYHYDVKIEKRTIHAKSELKITADDDGNSESETTLTADDDGNSESETTPTADDDNGSSESGTTVAVYDGGILEPETTATTDNQNNSESEASDHKKYKCLNTRTFRKVLAHMIDNEDIFSGLYPSFDGKSNLYTRQELETDFPLKCEVILANENFHDPQQLRQDIYDVTVRPVKKHNTTSCAINLDSVQSFFEGKTNSVPEEAMMAVETILRHTPSLHLTPIGRSFFYSPNPSNMKPIGGGIEVWLGYHQSTLIGQWKPTVNIDIAATTFLSEGPVLNYFADAIGVSIDGLRRIPFVEEKHRKKISHQLANKEIRSTHLKYRHRIIELTDVSANDKLIQGKELSVADYFKQKHDIILKYPNLPCLRVKPENKDVCLPLEVCEFTPGQHYRSELTPSQKSNMISFTTVSAVNRFRKIDNIVKTANFNNDKCVQEFDLKVSSTPLEVDGRVLYPPNLMYAEGEKISPKKGSWNMKDVQFLKGGEISRWMLVSFRYHENLRKFANILADTGKKMGIKINRNFEQKIVDIDVDIQALLSEAKKQVDLVVIVIPQVKDYENKRIYSGIKRAAETLIGLSTQCIKEERLEDMKSVLPIVRNLCLKINAKTGGENYTLVMCETPKILWTPVIIIGADVSHPAPTETNNLNKPKQLSIAACVGSLDSVCKRFAATVRLQPKTKRDTSRTEEIICSLEDMTVEILKKFYRYTGGKKPEKIILYRDGVSEGEFAAVKNREVVSVRKACKSLPGNYEPGITFIVVQKRHHRRFTTKDPRDGINGDVPEGFVADTVVTHKLNYDFYLKSQAVKKGTSRPSYYTVIEDDNDFSANDLQKMTYHFCHMYVRCTKSISVPAPVQYAHLVADRARKYLYGRMGSNGSDSSDKRVPTLQDIYKEINVLDDFKGSMYFV